VHDPDHAADRRDQDVNAQHMAAMGLAGVSLGTSFADQERARLNRCPSIDPETGGMCAITRGHTCSHARGKVTWPLVGLDQTERNMMIDMVAKAFHPEPDEEDIATAEIAVDAVIKWQAKHL
jgi:hypothetical protein